MLLPGDQINRKFLQNLCDLKRYFPELVDLSNISKGQNVEVAYYLIFNEEYGLLTKIDNLYEVAIKFKRRINDILIVIATSKFFQAKCEYLL
jgi:hypothetical protein